MSWHFQRPFFDIAFAKSKLQNEPLTKLQPRVCSTCLFYSFCSTNGKVSCKTGTVGNPPGKRRAKRAPRKVAAALTKSQRLQTVPKWRAKFGMGDRGDREQEQRGNVFLWTLRPKVWRKHCGKDHESNRLACRNPYSPVSPYSISHDPVIYEYIITSQLQFFPSEFGVSSLPRSDALW